jgi:hypothetical protein
MITIIEAQEMLKELTVQDWPNQKQNQRSKLHKQLYKKAYPGIFREGKEMSQQSLSQILERSS